MLAKDILPFLGRRRVAEVNQGDVLALHQRITDRPAPVRANRALALVSCLFSLAMTLKAGEPEPWRTAGQGNPAKGIEKNPEEGRERFFSEAELDRIAGALNEYPGEHVAGMFGLMMLTGCRPCEATAATWGQIDFPTGTWTKPSAHTKQRRVHRAPLAPAALELLQRARDRVPVDCALVFPGRRSPEGEWMPIRSHKGAWDWVRTRAKLEPDSDGRPARAYDLRHSFASIGAAQGLSLLVLGKLLGHSQAATTAKYAHLSDDPLRAAAEKITGAIANAGKTSDNVVDLGAERG
jgi:integrase